MADEQGYSLTEDGVRRVRETVERVLGEPAFGGGDPLGAQPSGDAPGAAPEVWLKLNSATPTGGRFPAQWWLRDAGGDTITAQGSASGVWAKCLNSSDTPALSTSAYYRGFCSGVVAADGKPEFAILVPGSGGSSTITITNGVISDFVSILTVGNGLLLTSDSAGNDTITADTKTSSGNVLRCDGAHGFAGDSSFTYSGPIGTLLCKAPTLELGNTVTSTHTKIKLDVKNTNGNTADIVTGYGASGEGFFRWTLGGTVSGYPDLSLGPIDGLVPTFNMTAGGDVSIVVQTAGNFFVLTDASTPLKITHDDKIAFFSATPVVRQGTPVTLTDVINLLKAYGLCP